MFLFFLLLLFFTTPCFLYTFVNAAGQSVCVCGRVCVRVCVGTHWSVSEVRIILVP